jgi:hypothetical protein
MEIDPVVVPNGKMSALYGRNNYLTNSIEPNRQNIPMTPEIALRALFVENNLKTYLVLLDRAAWFWKGHQVLSMDKMVAIRRLHPKFPMMDAAKPLNVAYSYANAVFLVSAIETFILLTYTNSVVLFYRWKGAIPGSLSRSLEKKKQFRSLGPIKEELRSLSIGNIAQAEQWFVEIYGDDFLGKSFGISDYKKFQIKFNDLISKRNSIVHRGGESKEGIFIELCFEELNAFRVEAEKFGKQVANSVLDWWLKQLRRDATLKGAVLSSILEV